MKVPFHVWSDDGSAFPLALKLQREGHPVTMFLKSPEAQHIGGSIVQRAAEPPKGAVVLFDCVGQGDRGLAYRKQGHLVIGGNPFDVSLEKDRAAGIRIMHQNGIKTPTTFPFKDISQAIRFLEKQEGAWFVKVSGSQVESSTCDAPNPEYMIRYLRYVEQAGKVDPFELQQTMSGTEISCNGWFNGREFITPFDITMEEKRLMNHELGPRTGCESCVVWLATDDRLAERTVLKIEEQLESANYVGPIDLNSLVNNEGVPYGLEWTARLGFDAIQAWMRFFDGDLGEQLEAFASGELGEWETSDLDRVSLTSRLSIPPYPTWDPKLIAKTRGLPLDARVLSDRTYDPVDVMESNNGIVSAGGSGIIGTAGAIGPDLDTCRATCRDFQASLVIPNKQYRTHLVERAQRDLTALSRLHLLGHKAMTVGSH
jgi:phosphoribosylamine--glycine ligase